MTDPEIILTGVGGYLALMLGIGIWAAKRNKSSEDFIVAGRSLPLWLCSATVMATWIGGATLMGAAGETYESGILAVIADPFGAALGLMLVGLLVVRIIRRLKLFTIVEFFEGRYGPIAGGVMSFALIFANVGWCAALMVAFGFVFNSLTGFPLETGIMVGGAIVLIYTTAGGMWAVALTDFVQVGVIVVGLVILIAVVMVDMGGWAAAWAAMPAEKLRFYPTEYTAEAWLNYMRAWLIIGIANLASQSLLQRGLAAKTERIAQNSFYIAGIGYFLIGCVPVFLGIFASVVMPDLVDKETVLPDLAMHYLHPVLMAIFVGALLAAIMSSADSALLTVASVTGTNVAPKISRWAAHNTLLVTRATIPIAGVFAIFIGLATQEVYEIIIAVNAISLAAIVVPFMVGIWWRRANRSGGLASIGAGLLVWAASEILAPELPGDLLGMFASLLAILIVAPLTQKSDPPAPLLTRDGEEIELEDRLGTLARVS